MEMPLIGTGHCVLLPSLPRSACSSSATLRRSSTSRFVVRALKGSEHKGKTVEHTKGRHSKRRERQWKHTRKGSEDAGKGSETHKGKALKLCCS